MSNTDNPYLFTVIRSDNRDVERNQLNKILNRLAERPAGVQGASAYEVAVANGFVGTEAQWLASLAGPQGPQGIQGIQGIQGPEGPQGPQPPLSSTTPAAIGTAAVGVGTTAARADHVHAHGNQAGGSLHADVVAGGASGFMSGTDKSKLDGVAVGATANATDAALRDRSTHTGTQAFSTITGTVPVGQGGTGLTTLTTGNFLRAATASTLEQRTPAQVLGDIGAAAASHTHTASQISDSTAAGRAVLTAADATAQRTALGLGTAATQPSTAFQPADDELSAIAGLTSAADRVPFFTGLGTAALATLTAFGRSLVAAIDAAAARTVLGLGNAATSALSTTNAAALGTAAPGSETTVARADHVHPMPTAAQVGADPAGTAAAAVNARIPAGTTTGRYARWNNTAARWEEFDLLGAANTWTGTNAFTGAVGVGGAPSGSRNLDVGRALTGSSSPISVIVAGQIQSDATAVATYVRSLASTQAATFTVGDIIQFWGTQGTFGAGSTVNTQTVFWANASNIGATNNYGFRGSIPAGTGRWNLFMDGTANNAFAGNVRIGSTAAPTVALDVTGSGAVSGDFTVTGRLQQASSSTETNVNFGRPLSGAATYYNVLSQGQVRSSVTATASYFLTAPSTQAASFTLSNLNHYATTQLGFGAGSTVTTQNGFIASSTLIGATNNFGFRGSIPAGTGRWNLFMDGTAPNHLSGRLLLGTTDPSGATVRNSLPITGSVVSHAFAVSAAVRSDVTSFATGYNSDIGTQAASFTVPSLIHYRANQGAFGAGSTVSNQIGFAASASMIGGVSNFGFYGDIPAGAGRWNFFAAGTANNAFAGNVRIGSTAAPTVALDVTGSAAISGTLSLGGVTQAVVQQGASSGLVPIWNGATGRYEPGTVSQAGGSTNNYHAQYIAYTAAGIV